jgi:hypothetical protein
MRERAPCHPVRLGVSWHLACQSSSPSESHRKAQLGRVSLCCSPCKLKSLYADLCGEIHPKILAFFSKNDVWVAN